MNRENRSEVVLEKNASRAFRTHAREKVSCLEGTIWVTQNGVQRDFVLAAGESAEFAPRAELMVSAMTPSRYRVSPPAPCPGAKSPLARVRSDLGRGLRSYA
jgi:hypothetical protein